MIMLPKIDTKEWQLLVNSVQHLVITPGNLDQIFNTRFPLSAMPAAMTET